MRITIKLLAMVAGMGLMLASPAMANDEKPEPKNSESSHSREGDAAKRHITCQVECEKDGEDPYQCEEFCVQMADLKCVPSAVVAKY